MKKNIKSLILSISAVTALAIFTGCGSSSSDSSRVTQKAINSYTPSKIDRAVYEGLDSKDSSANISFDMDNSNIRIKIDNLNLNQFTNNQFFIDSDNNKATGLEFVNGSDYLIENSHIFQSTGTNWSWRYIGDVSSFSRSDDLSSIEITINRDLLNIDSNRVTITSFQRDAEWKTLLVTEQEFDLNQNNGGANNQQVTLSSLKEAIKRYTDKNPDYGYMTINDPTIVAYSPNSLIVVFQDGYSQSYFVYDSIHDDIHLVFDANVPYISATNFNFLTNNTLSYNIISGAGGAVGYVPYSYVSFLNYDINTKQDEVIKTFQKGYNAFNINDKTLSVNFNQDENSNDIDSSKIAHFQIFINSDDNKKTGYINNNSGADYLIEDGKLYKSTGSNWSWERVANLDYSIENGYLTIHLDNMSDLIKEFTPLYINGLDSGWDRVVKFKQDWI